MAKLFSTLGYAVDARGRGADRVRDQLRASPTARCPSRPARSATPSRAARARNATWSSSAPAPAARSPRRPWPRPGSTSSCSRPATTTTATTTRPTSSRRSPTLYRDAGLTIAEGRPPIPVPVAKVVGGTTVINSGTCFRAPDSVLEDWRQRVRHRLGARPRRRLRRGRGLPPRHPARPRAGWAATASWRWRARRRSAPAAAPIHRNAGNCVQCSSCPFGCAIDAKRGMHVSYLPRAVAAGARIRAGVEVAPGPGRGRARGRGRLLGRDAGGRPPPLHGARPARRDRRRRRPRHAGAAAALRARRLARSAATSTSTPPAGSAPATRRRCAAGTGVMQSYYVDEWEHAAGPARGDLHAAGLRRRLAARRRRASTSEAMLDFGHVGSIGVHLSRQLRPAGSGSAPKARCAPATS